MCFVKIEPVEPIKDGLAQTEDSDELYISSDESSIDDLDVTLNDDSDAMDDSDGMDDSDALDFTWTDDSVDEMDETWADDVDEIDEGWADDPDEVFLNEAHRNMSPSAGDTWADDADENWGYNVDVAWAESQYEMLVNNTGVIWADDVPEVWSQNVNVSWADVDETWIDGIDETYETWALGSSEIQGNCRVVKNVEQPCPDEKNVENQSPEREMKNVEQPCPDVEQTYSDESNLDQK